MSRIFKATRYLESDEKVILAVKRTSLLIQTDVPDEKLQENDSFVQKNAEEEASLIIRDAEETAQKLLEEAARKAEEIKLLARQEIDQWWQQKRQESEIAAEELYTKARREGYLKGLEEGKAEVREEEQQNMQLARDVLAQAHAMKEKIIAEAEPFLVELSVEIARKIICDELSASPEKLLEVVKQVLKRSRVHGGITISVHPRYFAFVEEHRIQLLSILDGRAELSVIPDYAVRDEGCVIKTPFGSVDARIDTQLSEIRQVLLEIARGSDNHDVS